MEPGSLETLEAALLVQEHKDQILKEAEEEQLDMALAQVTPAQVLEQVQELELEHTDQQSVEHQEDSTPLISVPVTTNLDLWDQTTEQVAPVELEWEQDQPTLDQSTKQEDQLPTYPVHLVHLVHLVHQEPQVAINNPATAATLNSTKEEAMVIINPPKNHD